MAPDTKTWKLQVTLKHETEQYLDETVFNVSVRQVLTEKKFMVHVNFKHKSGDRMLFSKVATGAVKSDKMIMFCVVGPK